MSQDKALVIKTLKGSELILRNFSPIVPPSATGVRLRRSRRWRHLVAEGGTF